MPLLLDVEGMRGVWEQGAVRHWRRPTPEGQRYTRRLLLLLGCLGMGFLIVAGRLVQLHLFEATDLAERAQRQSQKVFSLVGERGRIYDREGRELAIDVEGYSFYVDPARVQDPVATARTLARLLGMEFRKVYRKATLDRRFVWIRRQVPPEQARAVMEARLPGVRWIPEPRRVYPRGSLLAQVLGFVGVDHQGLEGLERHYDALLRGKTRGIQLIRDARGRAVLGPLPESPLRGRDLMLTVDEVLQYITERELDRVLQSHQARQAMGILMDPWTGEILAMAVRPAFDPNEPGSTPPDFWRNRVITDIYEPGSTFKIVVAAAVLEEGLARPETVIHDGQAYLEVEGGRIRDAHPFRMPMTFLQVLQHSSNVGAALLALRLGEARFYQYIRRFGFGERTGIDLPGEVPGLVRPPVRWSRRSLPTLAIGQEIGVTPLQMVRAMAVFANGGWLVRPRILRAIRDEDGVWKPYESEWIRRVISPETAVQMNRMLQAVVTGGTGQGATVPGYTVAGKTGTAQKLDPETGRYSRKRYISSFVGFVPATHPRLVILVLVDEPKDVVWGGQVAAPVFREIAIQALRYLQIPPEEPLRVATMRGP